MGELIITREGLPEVRAPIVAANAVAPSGFMVRIAAAAMHLLERINTGPQDAS